MAEQTGYVRHHKAKIALILASMRHHAQALEQAGWRVDYVPLDDPDNSGSFTGEVARAIARHAPTRIVVTEPGEWRVLAAMEAWETLFGIPVIIREDSRFIASHAMFNGWANDGRKSLRMEFFYREVRRATGILMEPAAGKAEGGQPVGGQWNYDADNRKPGRTAPPPPVPPRFAHDAITRDVLTMVASQFADHPGSLDQFHWPVTAADAATQMDWFLEHALPRFGDYQDAMLTGQPTLWHSLLSPAINSGLIDPLALCHAVEAEYHAGRAPLNAAEGFIRQIIGCANICAASIGAKGRTMSAATILAPPATSPLLLDRRHRHELYGAGDSPDAGDRPCPPYPAADGHRQFRVDRRHRPLSGPSVVS